MPRGVKGSGPGDQPKNKTLESQAFVDVAGTRLRLALRRDGASFQVYVLHVDGKKRKSGVLHVETAEEPARQLYEGEIEKARRKGWQPAVDRRGTGGLTEIPDPVTRPVPVPARHAGGGYRRAEGEALIAA